MKCPKEVRSDVHFTSLCRTSGALLKYFEDKRTTLKDPEKGMNVYALRDFRSL